MTTDAPLRWLESRWDSLLQDLCNLATIPGVSADPPPNPALLRSAEAVEALLRRAGLEHVQTLQEPGGHPNVYADWLHAPGKPTVLLYAHHDVQPPGDHARWRSPAFEPSWRDGRLYARGIVDDKAGVLMHVAACSAYLKTHGALPLNVKVLIEGEEEIGSPTLQAFLSTHKERLKSDVIVLTDTANLDQGIPSLTTSLRGIVTVQVRVRALDKPLHSGMWGGPVPDPVLALSRALAALTDDNGAPAKPFWRGVRASDHARERALPFNESRFREQAGLVKGASLVGDPSSPVWARVWHQPSVAVLALEARAIEGSSNQILSEARARVSIRIVADQDPAVITRALSNHFREHVPWHLETEIVEEHGVGPWSISEVAASGPAFEAASRALARGYGVPAVQIGCGGTIPFVEPFTTVFAGAPALLVGLEDPLCGAHAENESLYVDDWKKGIRSLVHLFAELAS